MRLCLVMLVLLTAHARADDDFIDAHKWLKAHGVMGEIDATRDPSGCSEIVVGKAREPALSCIEIEETATEVPGSDIPFARVITHQTINVARAGKVIVVLDAATRLESFDANPGQRPMLQLRLRVAGNGMSARIDVVEPGTCTRVDDELERRMCAARGSYVWTRHGRFERSR